MRHSKPADCRRGLLVAVGFVLIGLTVSSAAYGQTSRGNEGRIQLFAEFAGSFATDVTGSLSLTFTSPAGTFTLQERKSLSKSGRLFAGVRLRLTRADFVEVSYSYNPVWVVTTLTGSPLQGGSPLSEPVHAHSFAFNYVRYLLAEGRVRPFVTGGLGLVAFDGPIETEKKLVGNLGMGIDFGLSSHFLLRIEERAFLSGLPQHTFTNSSSLNITGTSVNFVPSAGLVVRF